MEEKQISNSSSNEGQEKQNKEIKLHLLIYFDYEDQKMKQARTLNEKELNLLLLYINTRKHAARDRAMLLMTFYAGMRIAEVAATKIKDASPPKPLMFLKAHATAAAASSIYLGALTFGPKR